VVTEEASSSETVLLPKLKPFPAISFDGTCGVVTVPSDLKLVCWKPVCSADFPQPVLFLETQRLHNVTRSASFLFARRYMMC